MGKVLFLSGTTRGGTLEGISRSFAPVLQQMGIGFVEISMLNLDRLLAMLQSGELRDVLFVLTGVGMGLDLSLQRGGKALNLWEDLGIPCITLHGDSPAYFFDRHVVRSNLFISLYAFAEHHKLRQRLPQVKGPIGMLQPIVLDEIPLDGLDLPAKKQGKLLFLKNGKDPKEIRELWSSTASPRILRSLLELANELDRDLDCPGSIQIDDLVMRYFADLDLDVENLVKLRLFFIAQLDDYLRAVKCTRMAVALMNFPVEIRGNNWHHLDFTRGKASYRDDCDYVDSIGLIRKSLGLIDMSPNTGSLPHDRVMRAYGSHTLCLTNRGQTFLEPLPFQDDLSFSFDKDSLQSKVADLLANPSRTVEMGIAVAESFRKSNWPERSFEKMLDYAALARLDATTQRVGELQDFFVWPPQAL